MTGLSPDAAVFRRRFSSVMSSRSASVCSTSGELAVCELAAGCVCCPHLLVVTGAVGGKGVSRKGCALVLELAGFEG